MATITENLETLKINVARMKEAIGVPETTPLEDITKAVEDSSKTIQAGVYVVEDESELENLSAKEGELALKYENTLRHPEATEALTSLYFPDTFTLDTAVSSSSYGMYRDTTQTIYRTRIYITATTFYVMDEYEYMEIVRYSSTDGKTYKKQAAYADVMEYTAPGNQTKYSGTGTTYLNGMFIKTSDFKLWKFSEGAWAYADIGCDVTAYQIFKPGRVYTNEGMIEGGLDRADYREDTIYYQSAEPESKRGLWLVPRVGVPYSSPYNTKDITAITTNDVTARTPVTYYRAENHQLSSGNAHTQAGDVFFMSNYFYIGSTDKAGSMSKCVQIGNYLYVTECVQYSSSSYRYLYRIDLETGSYTTRATPTIGGNCSDLNVIAHNDSYIMAFAYRTASSPYPSYTLVYDIAANKWTYKSAGFNNDQSNYKVGGFISIDDGTRCLVTIKNSTGDFIARIINFATGSTEKTITIYADQDGITKAMLSKAHDMFWNLAYTKEGNIITTVDGLYTLDVSNITAETLKESFRVLENATPVKGIKVGDRIYTIYNTLNSKFYQDGANYRILMSTWSDTSLSLSCCGVLGDKLVLFSGSSKKAYKLDTTQLKYLPMENLVIQTGEGGKKCEISENLHLKVVNAWGYYSGNPNLNDVIEIYIGDGKEWKLFRTNS